MRLTVSIGVCAIAAIAICAQAAPVRAAISDAVAAEVISNCTADQMKRGKSQPEAAKACQCSVDEMKKALTDDQILLILAGMKNDKAAATQLVTKNGPQWITSTMQTLQKAGPAADALCGTK